MKTREIFYGWMIIILLSSCASRKSFVYLQDMNVNQKYPIEQKHEAVVHRDDRLSIIVNCKNPELAIPFNMQGGSFQVGADGDVTTTPVNNNNINKGYRVDVDGNIDFPILGKLHVEGLTVSQVTNLIKERIIQGNYIKDPLISIEFLNFKYTVMGAVGRNGTYNVDGDRITLLEAIANAGDLTSKAQIKKVAVIREVGGERQIFIHDLRNKEIFTSPCFYLQQNDIVYVEPKYKKKDTEDRGLQYTTLLLSLVTAGCSLFWAIK